MQNTFGEVFSPFITDSMQLAAEKLHGIEDCHAERAAYR